MEETILQIVASSSDSASFIVAESAAIGGVADTPDAVTYDTLTFTRSITLSGANGHLIRSTEIEREAQFTPARVRAAGDPSQRTPSPSYSLNQFRNELELVGISTPDP